MAIAMILLPVLAAVAALAISSNRWRPWLLPVVGAVHLGMTGVAMAGPSVTAGSSWLVLDPVGRLVLMFNSGLFLPCSLYAVGYLHHRQERSNRGFCACLLTFLGVMTLVTWSHHLGLLWVAIEAATLTTAPLIYFNRTARSIEATWKYLLIGSVGVALALLGSFFLAYASFHAGLASSLTLENLLLNATNLSKPWLHAAFVLLLVGYGTKMGLAPMHTWKPDAYGEASGVVGALLATGLTSCAFLAILRVYHICLAAGEGEFAGRLLVFVGLFSMATAGVFLVGQRDIKRMLAYSSVEQMGILVLGLGIGGSAIFGSLLHMLNNGLTKSALFLSAGNIHRAYHHKMIPNVTGAIDRVPLSGVLFLAGFLAITGSPPFGPFISQFTILNAAFERGQFTTGALLVVFLLLVFVGMGAAVLTVVQGRAPATERGQGYRDNFLTIMPPAALLGLALLLGVCIPDPLNTLLDQAAHYLEVKP